MEGVKNLGTGIVGGIGNIASTAGSAVEGTTALAKKATDVALKVSGKSIDAAGVIGSATVDAASAIGSSSVKAATDIGEKGIETTTSIATGALGATDTIANAALDASATASVAATETVATAATVSADVTKQAITDTGKVLKAGVSAGTRLVEMGLNGIRTTGNLVAQKSELIANRIEASTSAKSKAFEDMGRQRLTRDEAMKEFTRSKKQVREGLQKIISIQKMVLAANIHMYRKAKCGWFSRTLGLCSVKVSDDTNNAKRIAADFLGDLDRASSNTTAKLNTGKDASIVIQEYLQTVDALSENFQSKFTALIEKYRSLADAAMSSGGRRKKTYRKKNLRASRASRASRKRRAVL